MRIIDKLQRIVEESTMVKGNFKGYGDYKNTRKSKIKGLLFLMHQILANQYLVVYHEKSGKAVIKFTDRPVRKLMPLYKFLNGSVLQDFDWTLDSSELKVKYDEKKASEKISNIRMEVKERGLA